MADKGHLPAEEVRERMRAALRGDVKVTITHGTETWDEIYAGHVEFMVGDMRIVVFNDCDSFDYVESATAADGRTGNYGSWASEQPVDDEDYSNNNPDRGWTQDDLTRIQNLFKEASHG